MVRLKELHLCRHNVQCLVFQFQYGTIESLAPVRPIRDLTTFQFQSGTIERYLTQLWAFDFIMFQFQYGTIES